MAAWLSAARTHRPASTRGARTARLPGSSRCCAGSTPASRRARCSRPGTTRPSFASTTRPGSRSAPTASADAIIGVPSSGLHSNGYTLARRALPDLAERPPELGARSVADELLEPTVIYVRAVLELLASDVDVRGLAHITGDGFLNLTRLAAPVGYRIDAPLLVPPVFRLIASRAGVPEAESWEVFNMGCGFCVVVPRAEADAAVSLLAARHPGTSSIGEVTGDQGVVALPQAGLVGRAGEMFRAA